MPPRVQMGLPMTCVIRKSRPMKLSDWLTETGVTQAELAARTGLSEPTISRLVLGRNRPSWKAIDAIRRETGGRVTAADYEPAEAAA